jgi:hypothetical protein
LILDHAGTFTGQVFGLSGNGNPSQSDVIDLRDIAFGPGTTASFVGTGMGGVLTVSDAQYDTANILLMGNYQNSTFSISSDGMGGTSVVDPASPQLLSEGQFVFNDLDSVGKASVNVNVSVQNGGTDYVGSFVANALSTADGHEAIDWQFDPGGSGQRVTQSYSIDVSEVGSAAHSARRARRHGRGDRPY